MKGEVELMRKSVSSCGSVMGGRSKVSGGYMPLDGPSAGLSLKWCGRRWCVGHQV